MKIGVMVDRLEVGGVEKVAIQEVRALRDIGHDAELVILRARGEGIHVYAEALAEIPVRVLEQRLPRFLRGSIAVPGFSFLQSFHFTYPIFARALIRANEYDVLLAHGTYTCLTAFAVERSRKVPVAAFVWDPTHYVLSSTAYRGRALARFLPLLLPLAKRFDTWLARRARVIVLGGSEHRKYLEERGARHIVISYPAANPIAEPLPASARSAEMLAATAWKHGKRPEELLSLLERTAGMRLVLAGTWLDSALRAQFEQEVASRGLQHRVELTGGISEDALEARYAAARFVIQTWPSPGFGLSSLEAAARGTTFIAPRRQGSSALFRDGVDCMLFDAEQSETAESAVELLGQDADRAVEMGTNAWRRVRDAHTWAVRAAELADTLADLTA